MLGKERHEKGSLQIPRNLWVAMSHDGASLGEMGETPLT